MHWSVVQWLSTTTAYTAADAAADVTAVAAVVKHVGHSGSITRLDGCVVHSFKSSKYFLPRYAS